jgi:hypothetical protein
MKTVSTLFKAAVLSCLIATVSGCASNLPTYHEMESELPRLRAGYARVFYYCNQPAESTRQHDFICSLGDDPVGMVSTREFLFVDRPAGRYEINVKAGSNPLLPPQHFALDLDVGDVRYVQMQMKFTYPVQIGLKLAEADKGVEDLKTCTYVGKPLPTHPMR